MNDNFLNTSFIISSYLSVHLTLSTPSSPIPTHPPNISAATASKSTESDASFRRLYLAAKRRVEEADAARHRDAITHRGEMEKAKEHADALTAEIARLEFQVSVCGRGGDSSINAHQPW